MATTKDTWSATQYNNVASFVYSNKFTSPVVSLLDPKPGEKIIDFGCGSGEVSIELEKDGRVVVGLDSSESMIDKAKYNGLKYAHVKDIQRLHKPENDEFVARLLEENGGPFDAVFSNAALHWCKDDPAGVLEGSRRVLKPGGRFVIEMGGWGNCVGVRSALYRVLRSRGYDPVQRDPWFFPSEEGYRALLEAAGFKDIQIALVPRITPLIGTLADWLNLFTKSSSFFDGIEPAEVESIIKEVEEQCEIDCKNPSNDQWMIVYVRLRVSAILA